MDHIIKIFVFLVFFVETAYADTLVDESRNRGIPVEINYPIENEKCVKEQKCPVALLSAGYSVPHTKYSFLIKQLTELGYMVVAIGHELPSDPPLSIKGNLYESRSENWIRGARTLKFVKRELQSRYNNYDFDSLLLVGHSNGGDISSWLGNESKSYVKSIITLDHRRVPLPRTKDINIFSIRGSDFPADKGVLPSKKESNIYGSCVVKIPDSKHNDMSDYGPSWLKNKISNLVKGYLSGRSCNRLQNA